jgi:hypothetical protein
MYVHALHTVHAVPDLRIAAGRLRDGFFIEISIVFVVVVTPGDESPIRTIRNCQKLKAESYASAC